jgi:hypothetical protein
VGTQIFISGRHCKSAKFWDHSAIAKAENFLDVPVTKPQIRIFCFINPQIANPQTPYVCQSKIHTNCHPWTERMKNLFSKVQP